MLGVRASHHRQILIVRVSMQTHGSKPSKGAQTLRTWIAALGRAAAIGMEALVPGRCLECGTLYRLYTERRTTGGAPETAFAQLVAGFFCPSCSRLYRAVRSPHCTICGRPFETTQGPDHVCGACQRRPFAFFKARAAGRYDRALRTLIHHLKYKGCTQAADPLGRLLWQTFRRHWALNEIDLMVPVPLHPKRLRQRGFNQSLQLIRIWPRLAREEGIDWPGHLVQPSVLIRSRDTIPQTGLNQRQRNANLNHAFKVGHPGHVRGARVLLVDDVLTTGATAQACARTLIRKGARSVGVLTLACSV